METIHIRLTKSEKDLFDKIVKTSGKTLTQLVKDCLLSNNKSQPIEVIRYDIALVRNLAFETKKDIYYFKKPDEIEINLADEIIKTGKQIYKNIDKTREKVGKTAVKILLKKQMNFVEGTDFLPRNAEIKLKVTADEKTKIFSLAEDKNITVSDLIKQTIFSNCTCKILYVDSYKIDKICMDTLNNTHVEGIYNADNSMHDYIKIKLETILKVIAACDVNPSTKDIRREARRIVEES